MWVVYYIDDGDGAGAASKSEGSEINVKRLYFNSLFYFTNKKRQKKNEMADGDPCWFRITHHKNICADRIVIRKSK